MSNVAGAGIGWVSRIVERYHRDAADYARYWGPVLEQAAAGLLDEVEQFVTRRPGKVTIVDVGAGTGSLALAALGRWPQAEVVASDPAAGMLEVARRRATERQADMTRLRFVNGPADSLPLPDGSVDVVISSFVLQLVPDRLAALREAMRLLRPGGRIAYVTWLDRELREPFRPLEEFDEAVLDIGIEEEEEPAGEACAGDVPSPRAAAAQLRRAGFVRAVAREETLAYDWSLESYLDYKLGYDERALTAQLHARDQRRLAERARERLAGLPAAAFRWRAPIVFVSGSRPE